MRSYVRTRQIAELTAESTRIAYPWEERFTNWLDDPTIRRILPAVIVPPLEIGPAATSAGFTSQTGENGERLWSSERGGGEMQSSILRPTRPFLRFSIRGALGDGISLKFRDEDTPREHGAMFIESRGWRTGYVRVSGRVRMIVRDDHPERSIVFTEPNDVGRLSYYAEKLLTRGFEMLIAGVAIAAALTLHHRLRRGTV